MAKPRNSSLLTPSHLPLLLLFFFVGALSTTLVKAALGEGGKVGGRTKISDVKTNKEVQDLGKYCVEEYNRDLRKHHQKTNGSTAAVIFVEVVEAERQVVSGIKYYLKISAASASSGIPRTFTAVIVVKPWAHSKDLISFSPSPATK